MTQIKSSAELKGMAREHLFGNYGSAIGAYVLMQMLMYAVSMLLVSVLPDGTVGYVLEAIVEVLMLLIYGVFAASITYIYLNLNCGNRINASMIFYGFKACRDKAVKIQLFIMIRYFLAALPLIAAVVLYLILNSPILYVFMGLGAVILICGVVYFYLTYMPAFYMIHDFPNYDVEQLLNMAAEMMQHNKGKALYIYISFIPLKLLAILSFGIASLWVEPYMQATYAEFYLNLAHNQQ